MKGKQFLAIGVVLATAAAAYFIFFRGGSSPLSNIGGLGGAPQVTEADFVNVDDPNVRKHLAAQFNQQTYRVKSLASAFDGPSSSVFEVQIDPRGGSAGFSSWNEDANGTRSFEMMTVNGVIYVRDYSDNTWWQQTPPEDELANGDAPVGEFGGPPPGLPQSMEIDLGFSYENLGEEPCGNLTCHKYEEIDPQNTGELESANKVFWFDTNDYLLRKEQFGYGEFATSNEYFYDGINLAPPSPTKDVPEGQNIMFYLGGEPGSPIVDPINPADFGDGAPSQEDIDKMMEQFGGEIPN